MRRPGGRSRDSSRLGSSRRRWIGWSVLGVRIVDRKITAGFTQPIGLDVFPHLREGDGVVLLYPRQVDRVGHMLAFGVEADCSRGTVIADVALCNDCSQVFE